MWRSSATSRCSCCCSSPTPACGAAGWTSTRGSRAPARSGLYTAAYVAEALRSGVFSVGKGQIEASLSLGFSYAETLRRIVLPQAFRTVISPLGSLTIAMIKNSAIIGVSLLALPDLLKQARIVQARTFETDETFFWAAVGYLILTGAVTLVIRNLERRFAIRR